MTLPRRRQRTARELAQLMGIGERHVRRICAEPRASFLRRAETRQQAVVRLRDGGYSWDDIAAGLSITKAAAHGLFQRAKRKKAG